MTFKISSLNLCLGLPNKKNLVKNLLNSENIDVLCLQETELLYNLDHNLMSLNGYVFEAEINCELSRVGIYLKSEINYVRRLYLEGSNLHLVIIDVRANKNLRIINIYRSFNPQDGQHPRTFFNNQLERIRIAMNSNTILLGDFNLDWYKKGVHGYQFRNYFNDMENILSESCIVQLVDFPTWTRVVNNQVRESILDHLYCTDPTVITKVSGIKPIFGDHTMVVASVLLNKPSPSTYIRRDWRLYNSDVLKAELLKIDWDIQDDRVQDFWNSFENKLVGVVDLVAPLSEFRENYVPKECLPNWVKNKLNYRKRLLKRFRLTKEVSTKEILNQVDKSIKRFYSDQRKRNVRKVIIPGCTKSLWKAVNAAKDCAKNNIPGRMFQDGIEIESGKVSDIFGQFFDDKTKSALNKINVTDTVYNGRNLVHPENKMFMREIDVWECLRSLKTKNSEGMDRIPQRILIDGKEILLKPLANLFNLIYNQCAVPDQWLIAKTIPVYKNKGDRSDINNYRPIANLCSTSKIFEKLILRRIMEIQDEEGVDLTGEDQHGFKKKHSTASLSLKLQSQIARALDSGSYAMTASLDLSSAFDLVNTNLLIKRLRIIGLPSDIISLIETWLKRRSYYVSIDGSNSILHDLLLGTVQGSILGPVLYALYVSPLFEFEELSAYADDTYIPRWNECLDTLVINMEHSLERITKWLGESGLLVNKSKTEICLFYRHDTAPVNVRVENTLVETKKSMNVLGLIFDSKLCWSEQVASAVNRSNRSLNAIKIIRKFFSTKELIDLVTSNFYSVLYYNSEVWNLPNLTQDLKHSLFVASANALKVCLNYPDTSFSYMDLHQIANRATPEMFSSYKTALLLYGIFNEKVPIDEWIHLNIDIINTSRQTCFKTLRNHLRRIGLNCIANRLHTLNDKIPLTWLNKSLNTYKIECKKLFLAF
jgi:hypothetical protein